jgi:hypothetical protein
VSVITASDCSTPAVSAAGAFCSDAGDGLLAR